MRRTSPNVPATRASMAVHALTTSMGSLASALWAASETCVFTISATVTIRLVSTMPRVSWMTRAWLDATVRAGTKAKFANEISVPTSGAKTGRARWTMHLSTRVPRFSLRSESLPEVFEWGDV